MAHAPCPTDRIQIAVPAFADPHFVRSVSLFCQHDNDGAAMLRRLPLPAAT